ncbi:Bug family tripartite tricarboxylate transporter substrate binding protein [Sabulicella glaciei]|uniref:Tripartite tricarboxylate transporter substrate binding protein n=1 Tax=Sabulicella glaciei TaxID=2984948 RepID=A0ABT3NVM2_9PROT|nr:tripartite tricarboxylate transporter substrate binding protein [Roseococcus sp. MDT2-1-1]MCW8085614.1 tripartite tricarboxylate transporter substrate binding protein [Roseococcus sp. MDT2-1-1]
MRRRELSTLGLSLAASGPALAQWAPSRPVRIVVGFAPGGPADVIARVIADRLAERLGQGVVVENRVGAGGNIASDHVARAAPDGHTLMLAASALVQNAAMFARLPYDPVRDFSAISQLTSYPLIVVVAPSVPARDLAGLAELARRQPGGVTYGSAGVGTPLHLTGALFGLLAEVEMTHVPFGGAAPAHAALLGGQVQAIFHNPIQASPSLRAGLIRPLAVTGEARMAAFPEVPTVAEAGFPSLVASVWHGLVGPANMPAPVLARLGEVAAEVMALEEVRTNLIRQGYEVHGTAPTEFARYMRAENERWSDVIRRARISAE